MLYKNISNKNNFLIILPVYLLHRNIISPFRKMLQEFACYATKIEDKCGIMAVDTFVEATQKFSTVATCGETYHYLPTVIRVYKLQKEQAN